MTISKMICAKMGGDLHIVKSQDGENKWTYIGSLVADLQNLAPGDLFSARSHAVKKSEEERKSLLIVPNPQNELNKKSSRDEFIEQHFYPDGAKNFSFHVPLLAHSRRREPN